MVMSHGDHSWRLGAIERRLFLEKEIPGDEGQGRKLFGVALLPVAPLPDHNPRH